MTLPDKPLPDKPLPDEPPPVLGTWPRVYAFVLIYLAVLIALFTVFTFAFRH